MLTNQNEYKEIDLSKCSRYNIYICERGKKPMYLYTDLFEHVTDALDQACEELEYYYNFWERKPEYKDCIEEAHNVIKNHPELSLLDEATKLYQQCVSKWGTCNAILTEEDVILEDDLIYNYVFCNES